MRDAALVIHAGTYGRQYRASRDVGECLAGGQGRQHRLKRGNGRTWVAPVENPARGCILLPQPPEIELAGSHMQLIAPVAGNDPRPDLGGQPSPQLVGVGSQVGQRMSRRAVGPELLDQRRRGQGLVRRGQQHRKQGALPGRAQLDWDVLDVQLKFSEPAEIDHHHCQSAELLVQLQNAIRATFSRTQSVELRSLGEKLGPYPNAGIASPCPVLACNKLGNYLAAVLLVPRPDVSQQAVPHRWHRARADRRPRRSPWPTTRRRARSSTCSPPTASAGRTTTRSRGRRGIRGGSDQRRDDRPRLA